MGIFYVSTLETDLHCIPNVSKDPIRIFKPSHAILLHRSILRMSMLMLMLLLMLFSSP